MRVTWDDAKNVANQAKHGVSFEEASELFSSGAEYLEIFDDLHSDDEERFIAIGPVRRGVVLVVWTEVAEETTRIISARWASKRERTAYEAFVKEQR
ncbi:MAG: BrnT family toxin [Myxococcales bacterium]|nr:BrnT family toxin [Myxococcales bacterium]